MASTPPLKRTKHNQNIREFKISYWPDTYLEDEDEEKFSVLVNLDEINNDKKFEELVCKNFQPIEKSIIQEYTFGCLYFTKDNEEWHRLIPSSETKLFISEEIKDFLVGVKIKVKFGPNEEPIDLFCPPLNELENLYQQNSELFESHNIEHIAQMGDLEAPKFLVTESTYCYKFSDAILVPAYLVNLGDQESLRYWEKLMSFPTWTLLSDFLKEFPSATSVRGVYHPYNSKSKDPTTEDLIDFSQFNNNQQTQTLKDCGFVFDKIYKVL